MAIATRRLSNRAASLLHLNWLVKVSCSERIRVPEAVIGLDIIFAEKVVWRVAVITGGDRAMARLHPSIKLFSHDMTVGAGRRVIGQIRPALGIKESVAADTEPEPQNDSENDSCSLCRRYGFHLRRSLKLTFLVSPHSCYLSKSFWISSGLAVVWSATMSRMRAFCGLRLSAKMAPASLSVLPPPLNP
jgi:hypothetical protein